MLHRDRARQLLRGREYKALFVEHLGWNNVDGSLRVQAASGDFTLDYVAQKCGVLVAACRQRPLPDKATRGLIERYVAKGHREHLIVFAPEGEPRQLWLWVSREPNRPLCRREHELRDEQPVEPLLEKLDALYVRLEEEDNLTTVDMTRRLREGFDVDRVTRPFYDRFRREHDAFAKMVAGIPDAGLAEWYVAVTLNRLMFVYFIQKRGFLDGDPAYLANRLRRVQAMGKNVFYREFLCPLFFEGFARPPAERSPQMRLLLGEVPYLNGGIFARHQVEQLHGQTIDIPDAAFERIFQFFDTYQWHLDDRPLRNDNEINPDVLGYIFEKYINQKELGAYYTKEDITGYIARNTIIPRLFDMAREGCRIAFEGEQSVWRWLSEEPDRYIYAAVQHGVDKPLPPEISAGLRDVSRRGAWNTPAPESHALPTEIWRETIARRQRYEEVWTQLVEGRVRAIEDLVTLNLDIQQYAQDVIERSEGPELVRAFWKALNAITVLDPACGSGAFLFAALNVLEPLYLACLEAMEGFLEQAERVGAPRSRYSDFREILARVAEHPNKEYFILKSIILNNLYGVDIMPEAAEIARLRLFLALVAQVEHLGELEPLPDIDFNIRAGNSLVGFTSLDEVRQALSETHAGQTGQGDAIQARMVELTPEEVAAVQRIEVAAEDVDALFREFRRLQVQSAREQTAEDLAQCKATLESRLASLRGELDAYLAQQYGVAVGDALAQTRWRQGHQPFHWYSEFYGVMRDGQRNGGFDVIIGNPPYVEYSKVRREYALTGYKSLSCGNLYAYFVERSLTVLRPLGYMGMIVQLPFTCTDRMQPIQELCLQASSYLSVASFDDRPSRLFDGLEHIRAAIFTLRRDNTRSATLVTTRYHRWHGRYRQHLFATLSYTRQAGILPTGTIPKIGDTVGKRILARLMPMPTLSASLRPTGSRVYFHNAPQYWVRAMDYAPYFWNERDGEQISRHVRALALPDTSSALVCAAVLNSSLFYWWFVLLSDCRDLNMREIESFPFCLSSLPSAARRQLEDLSRRLMEDLRAYAKRKQAYYVTTGRVEYDEFYPRYSKAIIDEIDRVLAQHYGLTDEELDYIINYDIKYRMGLDNLAGDGDGEEQEP